jgi:GntR family transcriptional regulator/MocR family aminotransferase
MKSGKTGMKTKTADVEIKKTEEVKDAGAKEVREAVEEGKNRKTLAYMELYRFLRGQIISGAFPYGSKIPSKRLLASDRGVSVITVQHALALLEDEGFLQAKERSGYYVSYKANEFLTSQNHRRKQNPGERADFQTAVRNSTYYDAEEEFPFSTYARTVRRVLSERQEAIFQKSENQGSLELRTAIARYLGRVRNMQVNADQIVIGSGAEYLYGLISILIGAGKTIAVEDPSYQKIRRVYQTHGLKIEPLRMGEAGILSSELRRSRANAMHVTPFHSYPSEISATVSKKMEYLSWARKRKAILIEDDYDSEFSMLGKSEDTLFSMEPEKTVIYLNTFSRTISPSVRIGYMILPGQRTAEFLDRIGFYSCTVPVLDQYVLAELIREGDFERHLNRVRRKRRKEKACDRQ